MGYLYFYSALQNSFYAAALRARYNDSGTWPDDAIGVTEDEFQTYSLSQAPVGKRRGADADGRPCWVDLPETPLADLARSKLAEINRASEAALADLRRQYPQFEIDTWRDQETEARAWKADNTADTPTLSGIAEERGIALVDLVDRVIANADAYRPQVTAVIGKRQRLEDDLNAALKAGDRAAIEAIEWSEG